MTACSCRRYQITTPDGATVEGELERDASCPTHGWPADGSWPDGHPLRRYARTCWFTVAPEVWVSTDGRFFHISNERIEARLETPAEVEQRLYREHTA